MRKKITVTVPDGKFTKRDAGKVFTITEMSDADAEWWAIRAALALGKSGVDVPDDVLDNGFVAIAPLLIKSFLRLDPTEIKPLLDEMFKCVRARPDARNPDIERELFTGDIDEPATRLWLRKQILSLHLDFGEGAPA